MIICKYPPTAKDIYNLSPLARKIPINIEKICDEVFNIKITYKPSLRYSDIIAELYFNSGDKYNAHFDILDPKLTDTICTEYKLYRFMTARMLYFALYDPYNYKSSKYHSSYIFTESDLYNTYINSADANANMFALELLIPITNLQKFCVDKKFKVVDNTKFIKEELTNSKVELMAEYYIVTNEMIESYLYYKDMIL